MKIPNPFKLPGKAIKAVLAILLVLGTWAVWTGRLSQNLDINKKTVKLYDWPSQLENLKIIHLSDFHFDKSKENTAAKQAINWAAKQDVDLIVLTGDFVNDNASIDLALSELAILGSAKARLGTYAVLGEWDYARETSVNTEKLKAGLEDRNIKLLINEARWLEVGSFGFWLVGIDTQGFNKNYPSIENSFRYTVKDAPKIVLTHRQEILDLLLRLNMRIDLVLAGDTHGGQISLPLLGPIYANPVFGTKYLAGVYEVKRDEPGIEKRLADIGKTMFGEQVGNILNQGAEALKSAAKDQNPIALHVSRGLGENPHWPSTRFGVSPEATTLVLTSR
jgi:predicted MPP superfamily phosphohydrolase